MAEKWDFTKEDARICAKPLKQSSLLAFTQQVPLMPDERIQQTIEEREAKTTAALRQKERAEGIAKKWGLPWPEPSRKGQWGRMSREFRMKRELYAKIQRIVEGKEPEPASPPQLPVGSALGAKGSTQAEGHEVNEGNGGEGNVDEDNGSEGNGGEGNGSEGNGSEGNGGDGNGGEDGDKDDEVSDHQKLSKLHRPTWVKELFFSLQASQKLSIKDACGWVMENMPSIFCPNGKPLTSSTVCTWKKQLERKETHQTGDTPGKKKRGPKPSHPCGMVVAQYNAGFPLSTTLLMPMYRKFLLKIGLKYRTITKAARCLPDGFIDIKRMFLRRVVFIVRKFNIPPALFINLDETGVCLLPTQKRTWGPSGAKQISVLGWGDKRQFTVIPAISAEGKLVGKAQVIWAGQTDRCHPKGAEIDIMADLLFHSHSTSHWTTEDTILEYVAVLHTTNVIPKMKEQGLDPKTQKWVLLWDCYSVHRSDPVLEALKTKYTNLVILFVPASCTAELQPLDLSFNFVFKSGVATLFASWLSQVAQEQLLKGVPPEKLKFDLTLQNDDEIEERDTLYEEARALDRKRELFVVKGGRSKDAAVAGLLEQNTTESSKRKEQEMEMMDVTGSGIDDDFDVNGEKWTEMDELDEGVEARDENEFDGEESQLPDDLASCFNVTIQTTRYGRTTAIPSKFKN
eukprot:Em0001g2914a